MLRVSILDLRYKRDGTGGVTYWRDGVDGKRGTVIAYPELIVTRPEVAWPPGYRPDTTDRWRDSNYSLTVLDVKGIGPTYRDAPRPPSLEPLFKLGLRRFSLPRLESHRKSRTIFLCSSDSRTFRLSARALALGALALGTRWECLDLRLAPAVWLGEGQFVALGWPDKNDRRTRFRLATPADLA